ncbi:hypothetical protein HCZ23_05460 [Celeribacter sp. HF31]|uniref:hypothetical protein n=1 Tax=Celeribacter sp. HF31 TaxID=2721558 RepID=UPI001431F521|nr:hypothetical protein [Celeribacter sp. HF31]NIY78911.1 hypothetical protein [Celeribacter sp. HF31]
MLKDQNNQNDSLVVIPSYNVEMQIPAQEIVNGIRDLTQAIAAFSLRLEVELEPFKDVTKGVAKAWLSRQQDLESTLEKLKPLFVALFQHSEAKKPLQEHGILPHLSTPWDRFNPESPELFPSDVMHYYSTEWDRVGDVFRANVETYEISEDAKADFRSALKCHETGLYRSSVLTLLPSAEMEFRRAFKIDPKEQAASLKELRDAVGKLPIGRVIGPVALFDLFKTLNEHMYEHVNSPDDIGRFLSDPIPNRHAAIHGHVRYDSELNSLNALIMADYIFFLISQLSKLVEASE